MHVLSSSSQDVLVGAYRRRKRADRTRRAQRSHARPRAQAQVELRLALALMLTLWVFPRPLNLCESLLDIIAWLLQPAPPSQ
mmetsp:Transcript_106725/g.283913  ORF Transcript_106725/g.283913 Transcript_106725/m.283913 type:complete len:82 (-) Transcript_106725:764-1009(-)